MSRKKIKQKAAKRAAKGGKAHHTPNSKRNDSESYDYMSPAMPKFSLKDEARWATSHRSSAFESGKKLRSNPVSFVSAGLLEGTIPPRELAPSQTAEAISSEDNSPDSDTSSSAQDNTRAMAHMAIRSPSPAPSATSSSSDEVVFRGRNAPVDVQSAAAEVKTETKAVPAVQPAASKVGPATEERTDSDDEGVVEDQFAARRGGKPAWEGKVTEWESRSKPGIGWLPVQDRPDMADFLRGEENSRDSAMDDYMQNVEDFGLTEDMMAAPAFARREMDLDAGSHNDWESDSGSQEEDEEIEDDIEDLYIAAEDSWDSDMLEDFAELSTSAEATEIVARILSTRTRPAGVQYLCVYEGAIVDDARWLPDTSLSGAAHRKLVREFNEAAEARREATSSESDSDEDGEDDMDFNDDEDEADDLDGLGDEELDDEQIARVLQKQEELGLGSDEILLYAGDPYFDDPYIDFKPSRGAAGRSKQKVKRGRHHQDPAFPSATAMADALAMDPYGGFDIMDTERPSLKMKKKGRRGQMPPELEDPDLNEQMQKTWEADRAKKRLKKAEREELRKEGLLGRKGKSANLKVKYKGGIVMEDVIEEIRELIIGDQPTLSLPPMDASRRAVVHQVASSFKLTSKSRGDGLERFTVLSKTRHTRILNDDEFDRIINSKGFQIRMRGPLQNQRKMASASFRSGGKRVKPQVGYQDGDTVGANAPELGPENKGHALLSKMGWSKGMALGTTDNQGILQPIPHTVKINKAGLR